MSKRAEYGAQSTIRAHPLAMTITLTNDTYDGVCSIMLGNGSICTTVGPTGYHALPDATSDVAQRTQHFVWAGRRHEGPRHALRNFGSISRSLSIDGRRTDDTDWTQRLDCQRATCASLVRHAHVSERTTSLACLGDNCVLLETVLESTRPCDVVFDILYVLPERTFGSRLPLLETDCVVARFAETDNAGEVRIVSANRGGFCQAASVTARAVRLRHTGRVVPERPITVRTLIQFSDRLDYSFPVTMLDWDRLLARHEQAWGEFWGRSRMGTGNELVDRARLISLYTIRTQLTDWFIGPTLSEPYWGGGAFHDEMYPFFALISGGHADLASRMPRFRKTTLPAALRRGRGSGALYPWSSTEVGEERDPDGLWLTERFHLAQFSAGIWAQWLYERDLRQLSELYPVLHEIARYYENTVIARDAEGRIGTRPCVDFDESVGAVRNGPFTVSGASAALNWAAQAADLLGIHPRTSAYWRSLADSLRQAIVEHQTESGELVFGIPDGVPVHYSVLGHVFPFRTEVRSPRAVRTARMIHDICRSSRGWKPGLSSAFEGSNWQWTSGHLGIVHAMQNNPELAWEAIARGPEGSGPGLIPCEHINARGVPQVPWFTTGVGAWLYALNAAVAWVDEQATHLLAGIPDGISPTFEGVRGSHGVSLNGAFRDGVPEVTASAPHRVHRWRFSVPTNLLTRVQVFGVEVGAAGSEVIFETNVHDVPAPLVAPRS